MKRLTVTLTLALLPVWAAADTPKVPSNSVHVIFPYNIQGIWVFDDDTKGLVREPFVGAINPMVDALVTNLPDAKIGFRLLFSAGFIPQYDAKLEWRRQEETGNWYYCDRFKTEGWLCPSLLKYFATAPKEIYIRAEPLPKERIETWRRKRQAWIDSQTTLPR